VKGKEGKKTKNQILGSNPGSITEENPPTVSRSQGRGVLFQKVKGTKGGQAISKKGFSKTLEGEDTRRKMKGTTAGRSFPVTLQEGLKACQWPGQRESQSYEPSCLEETFRARWRPTRKGAVLTYR